MGGGVLCTCYVCSFSFGNTTPTCDHHLQLGLCWAITMHKSHGQTLDKAVIDLARPFARIGARSSRYVDAFILAVSGDLVRSRQRSSKFANFQSPTQSSPQPLQNCESSASRLETGRAESFTEEPCPKSNNLAMPLYAPEKR